jgi:TPR repeat protein
MMKRAKANDPVALRETGRKCCSEGDNKGGFEYFTKAAELGDIESHKYLADLYHMGGGVEKDMKKVLFHLEEAAIGGHHIARYNLGIEERDNERAVKHFIIAAKLGFDGALEQVKKHFAMGLANKEDFEAALRGYQAAVDATKSKQRDVAYATMNH